MLNAEHVNGSNVATFRVRVVEDVAKQRDATVSTDDELLGVDARMGRILENAFPQLSDSFPSHETLTVRRRSALEHEVLGDHCEHRVDIVAVRSLGKFTHDSGDVTDHVSIMSTPVLLVKRTPSLT